MLAFMADNICQSLLHYPIADHSRSESALDLAVIDLNVPGRGGSELIRTLKDAQPQMRILVYSMYPEDQFGVRALRSGADGYLTKDSPAEEIPKAVQNILEGRRYIGPTLAAAMAQTIVAGNEEPADLLSDREYQVFKKMAAGQTPSEIAQDVAVSIKTVSTYRARILEKLNLRRSADLIRYAVEHHIADV